MSAATVVLLPGLWLTGEVWDATAAALVRRGHRVLVPPLPGVDDGSRTATLEDQLAAVLAAVDGVEASVVVGHSAAATLAWLAADRRPTAVGRVVMVGGFPAEPGTPYAALFPTVDGVLPFPGWEPFEGPDSADLDDAARAALAAGAVPVPAGVALAPVRLGDERRYRVPVTLVCPEFSPGDARGWLAGGQLPELARATDLTLVDLDSGHWPMVTRPDELAEVISAAALGGPAPASCRRSPGSARSST